jgi:hypothetical protein
MRSLRSGAALLGLLSLLRPGTTSAQPGSSTDAPSVDAPRSDDELIASGIALRKTGHDAEALAVFQRAYAARPSARAMAQAALAHQALTDWREQRKDCWPRCTIPTIRGSPSIERS